MQKSVTEYISSFIVPLPRHVFLEANDAVSICDMLISKMSDWIVSGPLDALYHKAHEQIDASVKVKGERRRELISEAHRLLDSIDISEKNPIVIRYFLADSAEYKRSRISGGSSKEDALFYSSVPMPKYVWISEISTYSLYLDGYAFAEITLDATASKLSNLNSVLLLRSGSEGGFRLPGETYDGLLNKIGKEGYSNLLSFYPSFSNFD